MDLKRIIFVLLAALTVIGLTSCGSDMLSRSEKLRILIDHGKFNYPDSLQFVDDANKVFCFLTIEGTQAVDEWYRKVVLELTPEEMLGTPSMYKAVKYFGTEKHELYDYNKKLLESNPDSEETIPEFVIEALYMDRNDMLRQLANVTSLYYNGAVYSFDEVTAGVLGIPNEVLSDFADEVEPILRKIYGDEQYSSLYKNRVDTLRKK